MGKVLPNDLSKAIKKAIYQKADEFGYSTSGRIESGQFLDQLVEDPEIGGRLREYLPKERIRTYIKDGVLNAYTKGIKAAALSLRSPEEIVARIFKTSASIIQSDSTKNPSLIVLRSETGSIYIISKGTVLKWETALRKALEIISREPNLIVDGKTPSIILQLATTNQALTVADKIHIKNALNAVGVVACFTDE